MFVTNTGSTTTGALKYVLPAGDSITVGFSNAPPTGLVVGGYRLKVQQLALAENKTILMTGTQTFNSDGMSNPWHEGVSGEVITQIQARVQNNLATPAPDVVIVHAGTNDFFKYFIDTPGTPAISGVQTRYTAMLDAIFAKWPSTKVIVVTIGPWYGTFAAMSAEPERGTFNTYIAALPASYAGGAHSADIKVVDAAAAFTTTDYYGDGLHPNEFGYQLLAWRIWAQLKLWM